MSQFIDCKFRSLFVVGTIAWIFSATTHADEWPLVIEIERQPFEAATTRLIEALEYVGAPLSIEDRRTLSAAKAMDESKDAVKAIQDVLDPHCLAAVKINPESRVSVTEGPVAKELIYNGWRTFLVKVHNEAGVTARLMPECPNAAPQFKRSRGASRPDQDISLADVTQRFLDISMFEAQPLKENLSGLELEYRIIQIYCRDVGKREAKIGFNVGQGTQDLGFRNAVPILFESIPSVEVVLGVRDEDGTPTTAAFVFRDAWGRVYPNPARRLAPDFFFHNQIYRSDSESVHLPPGEYSVEVSRGPEYHVQKLQMIVEPDIVSQRAVFHLKRWAHAASRGWYSGDHHVHAAGCAHYENPTEGVSPADMMRHILGEDLNVGCVLSWGPCWYTQKQYFEGKVSALSSESNLMRYDVEVSGFPSSHAGHLCLLRLKEDDYPGTTVLEEWPSWTLPILKWGKEQGGVVGYSHSGWGLSLPDYDAQGKRVTVNYRQIPDGWQGRAADKLPDYAMPPFDGIGANEFIVTGVHNVCHFISAVDTPAVWELNIWYHTLNCGLKTRISGETDFPCIYGDKVGLGRIYVKIPIGQPLDFDQWIAGVRNGRSYCGDGLSHIYDLKVDDVALGEQGPKNEFSELNLAKPGPVKVTFDVQAMLAETPTEETERIRTARLDQKPYWHLERSRIGESRKVPVEVIVNGYPVATQEIEADGTLQSLSFDVDLSHSSWIAVRIFPSVHTNPVFVKVGGKPIRASRRSAEWCREAVDVCWEKKKGQIREAELSDADAAYQVAREYYDRVLSESVAE
ncbi:MAG: CehA/McbA family metallohydrolase [Planctomycetota bacterium]|nr:CehA/McbA family metallohydrolase [Planctomycetota bacterium]